MYGGLWRLLPGPRWFKAFVFCCLALLVVWICFEWFFPWLSDVLPFNQLTVNEPTPDPSELVGQLSSPPPE
jgi:hypothetical protein